MSNIERDYEDPEDCPHCGSVMAGCCLEVDRLRDAATAEEQGRWDAEAQLAGAVADRAKLCAAMVRCAEKLESFGNEEPAAVASHLRDIAHAHGGE